METYNAYYIIIRMKFIIMFIIYELYSKEYEEFLSIYFNIYHKGNNENKKL